MNAKNRVHSAKKLNTSNMKLDIYLRKWKSDLWPLLYIPIPNIKNLHSAKYRGTFVMVCKKA